VNSLFETPVTLSLDRMNVAFRVYKHPGEVKSLEQAAIERGQQPNQIVRSIIFRLSDGEYIMILVAGKKQISWPNIRKYLGVSRISMAREEEILEHTGYPIGAVSPFGLPKPMRILVDESVFDEREISIGSGVRNTTVMMKSEDLRVALGNVEIGCFVCRE